MLYIRRGIEDDHYRVVEEIDGTLAETSGRVERESDGYWLSHADNSALTARVFALGALPTPEMAVPALRNYV